MENKETKEEIQDNKVENGVPDNLMLNGNPEDALLHEEIAESESIEQTENFKSYSKEELVKVVEQLLTEEDYSFVKSKINPLKDIFNELISVERQHQLEKYMDEGGEKKDFQYKPDELEVRFNSVIKKFGRKRVQFLEEQDKQREQNLAAKKEILSQLKTLIQNEENMSKAFHTFHELQARWRDVGPIPAKNMNDLWMTYRVYIEKFYDLIKINRELQELDQRKNMEMKIHFCEKAEELILEPSLNKALAALNRLQNNWRETGTVLRDKRAELGERFKSACDKIFERRKEYLHQTKLKQEESLKTKSLLCEQAEQILVIETDSHHQIQEKFKQLLDLQNEWRKSGFTSKAVSENIWKRFKAASDNFYRQKNEFYHKKKKEYQENFQAKTELCIQAEALVNNTNWKSTAAELKKLFEAWKKIGQAGKMSDKIWNRFKNANDTFYTNRKNHFASADKAHEENYSRKIQLLEQIEQFKPVDNKEEDLNRLKSFQREWMETGLVPLSKKDELQARYRKAIDNVFNSLRLNENEKRKFQFKEKLENIKNAPDAREKMSDEKRHVMNKITQLNSDVQLWENNLGFFAKSKNADEIKKEFEQKINKAKEEISKLKEQLQVIKTF